MSVRHRTQSAPKDPAATTPTVSTERVPRTRTSTAWIGICATAVSFVALIVFMLQNTGSVEVSFLWMNGSLPLALALLIAGVGMAIVAMTIGAARMAQLRHLIKRR